MHDFFVDYVNYFRQEKIKANKEFSYLCSGTVQMHCGHCPQAPPPPPSWSNLFNVRNPCNHYAILSQICSDQRIMSYHPSVNDYLKTSPVARGQPPLPPLAAHSFHRAKVDGPLLSVCRISICVQQGSPIQHLSGTFEY